MKTGGRRLTLCVFIDGFGWELIQRHSFLDDLLVTKAPLGTVLGYSSTCIPTILTGSLPQVHGHLSFFYYNPEGSPFGACRYLSVLPRFITDRGRVRRWISKAIQRLYGFTGYFQIYNVPFEVLPLFDYSEKRDIYRPGGINLGTPTIFDHLREEGVPHHVSDWRASEESNIRALEGVLLEAEVEFAYLYLASMDALLHAHGTRSPAVKEKIAWYDRHIRLLIEEAGRRYAEVRVFIFSDHGMTDTRETCDLMARVEGLGLRFGVDYAAAYDSTMARFWFLNDEARKRILEALGEERRGRILSDGEMKRYGCDFPDRRYGQAFFLLDPGVLLCPSFMGLKPIAGMHGYDPEDPDSLAMFASNVKVDSPPRRLDDLHALMKKEAVRETDRAPSGP